MDEEKMTMDEAEEALFLEGLGEEPTDTTPEEVTESAEKTENTPDAAEALEQTADEVLAETSGEEAAKRAGAEARGAAPTVRIKFNHEERDLSLEEAARSHRRG